jgi:hypothetical protein
MTVAPAFAILAMPTNSGSANMAKTWEQMNAAEKIEDLRRDVKRLFSAFNGLTNALTGAFSRNDAVMREVTQAIEDLKKKLG